MKKIFSLLAALTLAAPVFAQKQQVGVFLGTLHYQGDLASDPITPKALRPAIGGLYRYTFSPGYFSLRGSLTYGRFVGNDANYPTLKTRNMSFFTDVIEASAIVEVNLIPIINSYFDYVYRRYEMSEPYNIYLYTGISGFYFNPKARSNGEVYTLKDYTTEVGSDGKRVQYSLFQPSIPIGLGFDFRTKSGWTIGIDAAWHKCFTDYIDDVSKGSYPNRAALIAEGDIESANLADPSVFIFGEGNTISQKNPNAKRAYSKHMDSYFSAGVTITKNIGRWRYR